MLIETRRCESCGTRNDIRIENNTQVWQCICGRRHWLNEGCRLEHMSLYKINFNEAESDLHLNNIDRLPIFAINTGIKV